MRQLSGWRTGWAVEDLEQMRADGLLDFDVVRARGVQPAQLTIRRSLTLPPRSEDVAHCVPPRSG